MKRIKYRKDGIAMGGRRRIERSAGLSACRRKGMDEVGDKGEYGTAVSR